MEQVEREELETRGGEKKKKKKRHSFRPDEEDIDLIQQNIGVSIGKRKRLIKHSEKEKHEEEESKGDQK